VRINPWEVHIRDPEWNEIYKVTRRCNKPAWYYKFLGSTGNLFATPSHDEHRLRRNVVQDYFTQTAVAKFQPELDALVEKLYQRMLASKGQIINVDDMFRCLATDVATAYAFKRPFGNLDLPDFDHQTNSWFRDFGRLGLINRHLLGLVIPLIRAMPPWVAKLTGLGAPGLARYYKVSQFT
jgi:cytochrome P450